VGSCETSCIETKSHGEQPGSSAAEIYSRRDGVGSLEVEVSDPVTGLLVRGLTQNDFIYGGCQPQQIAHFRVGFGRPKRTTLNVLIIDYSCSQLAYINTVLTGQVAVDQLGRKTKWLSHRRRGTARGFHSG